ncbi:xyloglucanase Xgh74A [Abditibacteriota bacterium]|nr:xyloglucanase Xgh74A [Abditibacteriota bacterium]
MKNTLRWPCAALFLSAALWSSLSCAQTSQSNAPTLYGDWRSSKIGGGGYTLNVVFTKSPSVLYAYSDVGGAFRSDDGGKRWRMLHGTLEGAGSGTAYVRDISIDPRDENRITLVCGTQWGPQEGIFQSLDGGKSWVKRQSAFFYGNESFRWSGRGLARNPKNADEILAFSGGDGVFRSNDGGVTWAKTGLEGLFPSDIQWSRDGKTVLASAQPKTLWQNGVENKLGGGAFISADGGQSWTKSADKAPQETMEDPQTEGKWWAANGADGIAVSNDGGRSWQDASEGLPREKESGFTSESSFQSLAASRDESGVFLVTASARGTFYRLNLPETKWQKLPAPKVNAIYEGREWGSADKPGSWPKFGAALASISINPRNPRQWFFTDWYAIRRSDDAGKTWDLSMDGVETTVLHALTPDPKDPGRVHLGMGDNGYMLSDDSGASFVTPHINSNMKMMSVPVSKPARVYGVGDDNTGQWRSYQVWISDDAGQSWIKSPMRGLPDMKTHSMNSILALPEAPDTVFVALSEALETGGGGGGVYRSDDGGMSFHWAGGGLPTGETTKKFFTASIWEMGRELAALPSGEVLLISRWTPAIYRLPSGQDTWQKVDVVLPGGGPYDVAASDTAFFVAVKEHGIYKVENGIATRIFEGDCARVAVSPFDSNRLATGTANGVFESSDAGKTWVKHPLLPNGFSPIVAFTKDRLLVGTSGNGVFWRSLDEAGLKPVQAQAVPLKKMEIAPTQSASLEEKWAVVWKATGALEVVRDPGITTLSTKNGSAQGSMGITLEPWSGSKTFSGSVKVEGNFSEAQVALQIFDGTGKQIGWQRLSDAKLLRDWTAFDGIAALPAGAKQVNLLVIVNGQGAVSVRDLKMGN